MTGTDTICKMTQGGQPKGGGLNYKLPNASKVVVVAYGAGTNGTGMLVGLHERGIVPDEIVFADTGSEKPHTYQHITDVSDWCRRVGFPEVQTIRGQYPMMIKDGSLGGECFRLGTLPAKAYGFSTCSLKWKIEPQRRHYAALVAAKGLGLTDLLVLIGFDADEQSRVDRGRAAMKANGYRQDFPLFDWGWTREDCVEAIERAGLPQPGKSSCYFCPSTTKTELLAMREQYPDLVASAVEMERRAKAGEGQARPFQGAGLGRKLNWSDFLREWDAAKGGEREDMRRKPDVLSPEQCDACVG